MGEMMMNIKYMEERVRELKLLEGEVLKAGDVKKAGVARGEANLLIV